MTDMPSAKANVMAGDREVWSKGGMIQVQASTSVDEMVFS
jgi:hypothetical protein